MSYDFYKLWKPVIKRKDYFINFKFLVISFFTERLLDYLFLIHDMQIFWFWNYSPKEL